MVVFPDPSYAFLRYEQCNCLTFRNNLFAVNNLMAKTIAAILKQRSSPASKYTSTITQHARPATVTLLQRTTRTDTRKSESSVRVRFDPFRLLCYSHCKSPFYCRSDSFRRFLSCSMPLFSIIHRTAGDGVTRGSKRTQWLPIALHSLWPLSTPFD